MTHNEFDNFQDTLLDEVVKMKNTKGKEYANGEDRFGNFKRLSLSLGLTPEQVSWVYLAKHLDSLQSYIRTSQTFSNESIRGRFVDAITYLTLIAGMVDERLQTSSIPQVVGSPTTGDHCNCVKCVEYRESLIRQSYDPTF